MRLTNIRRVAVSLRVLSVTQPFHLDSVVVYFLTVGAVPHVCAVEHGLSLSLNSFSYTRLATLSCRSGPRHSSPALSRHLSPSFGDSIVVRFHTAYLIQVDIVCVCVATLILVMLSHD